MRDAPSLAEGRLLECIITSTNADTTTNVAPMGPIVDPNFQRVLLRPFRESTTFANLQRERHCVMNVTDDVELIARAALNQLANAPPLTQLTKGKRLTDACRWYSLDVQVIDDSKDRTEILATVRDRGSERDSFGFNRAMHAVIEATIMATRLHLLPYDEVVEQVAKLAPLVEKTGGPRERRAFELVRHHIDRYEKGV